MAGEALAALVSLGAKTARTHHHHHHPPHHPARRISNTAVAVGVKKQPSVVMITALHDKPCRYPNGDYLNLVSILNKQDYARLHNYPIVVSTKLADPTLHNMWNKIGVKGGGGEGEREGCFPKCLFFPKK